MVFVEQSFQPTIKQKVGRLGQKIVAKNVQNCDRLESYSLFARTKLPISIHRCVYLLEVFSEVFQFYSFIFYMNLSARCTPKDFLDFRFYSVVVGVVEW